MLEIRSEKTTKDHQDIAHQSTNAANPHMNLSESNLLKFI